MFYRPQVFPAGWRDSITAGSLHYLLALHPEEPLLTQYRVPVAMNCPNRTRGDNRERRAAG